MSVSAIWRIQLRSATALWRECSCSTAEESKKAFELARLDAERWLRNALDPGMTRIREHKKYLDTRLASLQRILENMGTLHSRMGQLKDDIGALRQDKTELARIAAALTG